MSVMNKSNYQRVYFGYGSKGIRVCDGKVAEQWEVTGMAAETVR